MTKKKRKSGGINIGYARVSTTDQNLEGQMDALKKEGCEIIFHEKVSGAKKERPELDKCLFMLREGDTLVVKRLDRLGRTLKGLVEIMDEFKAKKVHLKCVDEPIDTKATMGDFFFNIMASFAQLERNLIRERTLTGLEAARKRGKVGGRPFTHSKEKKELAYEKFQKNDMTVAEIAKTLGMNRTTIYRYINQRRQHHATAVVC